MAWQPTTMLQISGYRFLRRRIECALLGSDVRTLTEPIRAPARSLMAGLVFAIILLSGCVVLALLRPQPGAASAPILMAKQSGSLYVRLGETLHPVLNLASARLIMKTNADPQLVAESTLSHSKRGPLLGIPGGPQSLGMPLGEDELQWTVCDGPDATTVVVGRAQASQSHVLARDQTLLVRPSSGGSTYLLYDGRRAVVNLDDAAVVRALELDGQVPLAASPLMLNLIPETPPLAAPQIPDAGARGPASLPGFLVGSVLRVARGGGDEYYVVLEDGVQRVGRLAADLVRFTDSVGTRSAISVAPDVIGAAPAVTRLPVAGFPDRTQAPPQTEGATLCTGWTHNASGSAEISFSVGGLPLSSGQEPVVLTQADGKGSAVDAVYVPPGRTAYVRATGLSGANARAGTRYLITDTGVRYAVRDDDAAHDLGLPDMMIAAPWPVLAKLPAGPELSRANASVAQDITAVGCRPARSDVRSP
ncbi:MAG TPA: type VII secretion protein EccB [Mycobacterium sp.]|jgi:type VII secretion protein EccB|uniref:type VII secretion protein EccB n=1 Tax=Mycobacterium sp. TaxID=1785 RepID=UPI002F3EE3A2